MSDLRHRSPEELRSTIAWCEKTRKKNSEEMERIKQTIADLQADLKKLGHKTHNVGQIECWARIYLAQKTSG